MIPLPAILGTSILAGAVGGIAAVGPRDELVIEVTPHSVGVGEALRLTVAAPAVAGSLLKLDAALEFDAGLATDSAELAPATADRGARLVIRLVACAPGVYELAPLALRLDAADGSATRMTTRPAQVTVTAPWSGDEPPGFGAWLEPPPPPASRFPWRRALVVGGLIAAAWVLAAAWRRRRARQELQAASPVAAAPPSFQPAAALSALAARIPAEPAARRAWWFDLQEWARATLDLPASATGSEFRDGDGRAWKEFLLALEPARFARAPGGAELAATLVERARACLVERRP